jgi:hypothetical protein
MNRRHFVATAAMAPGALALPLAGLAPSLAQAHHGWSSFDLSRPLYLEGRAERVAWRNPHAEMDLVLKPGLTLPADLAQRPVPTQTASVDGPALLRSAQLPRRLDPRWHVELAPLGRMQAWGVPRIADGDSVAMLGFTFAGEQGDAILRVEYLFLGGRTYGLRSSPA